MSDENTNNIPENNANQMAETQTTEPQRSDKQSSDIQPKPEPTFEAALARLEEIVHALDGGDAPLDKSLALFEEGVSLVKLCSDKLDTAEQRVKILVRGDDGKLALGNFTPPRD